MINIKIFVIVGLTFFLNWIKVKWDPDAKNPENKSEKFPYNIHNLHKLHLLDVCAGRFYNSPIKGPFHEIS